MRARKWIRKKPTHELILFKPVQEFWLYGLNSVINNNNNNVSCMCLIQVESTTTRELIFKIWQNDWADMTQLSCLINKSLNRVFRQDAANDKWLKGEQALTVQKKRINGLGCGVNICQKASVQAAPKGSAWCVYGWVRERVAAEQRKRLALDWQSGSKMHV